MKAGIYSQKNKHYFSNIFSNYLRHSLNALACLIAAFDLVRTCSNSLKEEGEKFLRDWLMFLIQESSYNPERISQVYSKLVDYYQKYEKITFISHNLTKYNKINFE